MRKEKYIHIRCTGQELEEVKALAKRHGMKLSQFIWHLIQQAETEI